jgi:hypothetical protein
MVVDGVGRFDGSLCPNPGQCREREDAAPCPGHGAWRVPPGLSLPALVRSVCQDQARPVVVKRHFQAPADSQGRGTTVWTAKAHLLAEAEHLKAQDRYDAWLEKQQEARRAHEQRIEDLMERQQRLVPLTVAYYKKATGRLVRALDGDRDPAWAMGVPVVTDDGTVVAVICPVASRVSADSAVRQRLSAVTVVVASSAEQQRLAKACVATQRFKLTEAGSRPAPPARASSGTRYGQGSIGVGQAVARMFGGY